jgi:hypothetical protein
VVANVSEQLAVSIFRAEVEMLESDEIYLEVGEGTLRHWAMPNSLSWFGLLPQLSVPPHLYKSSQRCYFSPEDRCFSKMMVATDESTRHQNPDQYDQGLYCLTSIFSLEPNNF